MANQTLGYDVNDRLTGDMHDANGNTLATDLPESGGASPFPPSGGTPDIYDFENHLIRRTDGADRIVTPHCELG